MKIIEGKKITLMKGEMKRKSGQKKNERKKNRQNSLSLAFIGIQYTVHRAICRFRNKENRPNWMWSMGQFRNCDKIKWIKLRAHKKNTNTHAHTHIQRVYAENRQKKKINNDAGVVERISIFFILSILFVCDPARCTYCQYTQAQFLICNDI